MGTLVPDFCALDSATEDHRQYSSAKCCKVCAKLCIYTDAFFEHQKTKPDDDQSSKHPEIGAEDTRSALLYLPGKCAMT